MSENSKDRDILTTEHTEVKQKFLRFAVKGQQYTGIMLTRESLPI